MTACPRCSGHLALQRGGALLDAHGVFLPESAFRAASAYAAAAALRGPLTQAAATGFACPACRGALREVPLGPRSVEGCATCGGWWFDRDVLEALRAATLARVVDKPRIVGGYGGTTSIRAPHPWGAAAEGLFAIVRGAGGYDAPKG